LDYSVRSNLRTLGIVIGLHIAGDQQYRHVRKFRGLLHEVANFVTISARHGDIGENDNGMKYGQALDGGNTVGNGFNFKTLTFQDCQRPLLNGGAVVGNQYNPSHKFSPVVLRQPDWRSRNTMPATGSQGTTVYPSHFGISMRGRVGSGHWAHGTADRGGTVNRCLFSSPVFSGLADTSTRGVVTRRIAEKGKTQGP